MKILVHNLYSFRIGSAKVTNLSLHVSLSITSLTDQYQCDIFQSLFVAIFLLICSYLVFLGRIKRTQISSYVILMFFEIYSIV